MDVMLTVGTMTAAETAVGKFSTVFVIFFLLGWTIISLHKKKGE